MNLRSPQAANKRVLGIMAIAGGFLASVLTMSSDSGQAETYILAGLLVLTGIGLRIEAAIDNTRT